jgi:cytochrome c oxidase subunit III
VWLILTEAAVFGTLIVSYFYLRFRGGPTWPPDGIQKPDLVLPLIMSAILWSSSIPVHLADAAIKKGNVRRMRWLLAAGWVLGAAFIIIQLGVEWPSLLKEFTPRTDAYGSLFYTLTGLHGLHVIVGLVISAWIQFWARRGLYSETRHVSVQNFTMYWHFVDSVWLFVLLTLYISPHI